ncbi:MAG: DUF501 domain-containing protein [Firmicutes bacterium]|nr:DUF501 domain-containing protein [Bacillota bacterium]
MGYMIGSYSPISPGDEEIITRQLRRRPRGLAGVARRCPWGAPMVVITHPLFEGRRIFPTIYWLTCPFLVKAIAKLESEGEIARISQEFSEDKELYSRLIEAHRLYAEDRLSLLSEEERAILSRERPQLWTALSGRGVAGVRYQDENARGVKCLHGHYAHFLSGKENPVGEVVERKLQEMGILRDKYGRFHVEQRACPFQEICLGPVDKENKP